MRDAFKYRLLYTPSRWGIEKAAELGMNWAIVHSVGLCDEAALRAAQGAANGLSRFIQKPEFSHVAADRDRDNFPIYFEDYPEVAGPRHALDADWLEPLREEVTVLCDLAQSKGLQVAFHTYEPMFPLAFESAYPDLVGVYERATQEGMVKMHSHVDPDNPAVWDLMQCKYAEMARDYPAMKMIIITTWDGAGSYLCIPDAKMPIHERLARLVQAAYDGVRSVSEDIVVVFRLWGRNWPRNMYMDSHRLIAEATGLENAADLMQPICKPHNDPDVVLPKVFELLPADVPIMYKATRLDIGYGTHNPLTHALGRYPREREQILEVSYENQHQKPTWCNIRHIRTGIEAAREHDLAGVLLLPSNMGGTQRALNADEGNLGRMNTWLLKHYQDRPDESDAGILTAWLAQECGAPQPPELVEILLRRETLVDRGLGWGIGYHARIPFASLHTTKLYWFFDGFVDEEFPYRMANPGKADLEALMAMRRDVYDETCADLERIRALEPEIDRDLFAELVEGYEDLARRILLLRDWHSYLLMQWGIEKGAFPADRLALGRMSRYVEQFIANLADLKDTPAGQWAMGRIDFPDNFPLNA